MKQVLSSCPPYPLPLLSPGTLPHKAAPPHPPSILLFTLIRIIKEDCCVLLSSLLSSLRKSWLLFVFFFCLLQCYFQSEMKRARPLRGSHQVFMGILATRVKILSHTSGCAQSPEGRGERRRGTGAWGGVGIRYRRVDELCAVATDWGAER